ncbi:MAG TPA: LmeA family phospholipid-binding protein [Trebonia sp.]|jgi:hypothetical protein|nr:LmeA family phospholipid-binding protein [Trebonia sp.]
MSTDESGRGAQGGARPPFRPAAPGGGDGKTLRIDQPGQPSYQPPSGPPPQQGSYSPPPAPGAGKGWPEQPPAYGTSGPGDDTAPYGAGGQYGSQPGGGQRRNQQGYSEQGYDQPGYGGPGGRAPGYGDPGRAMPENMAGARRPRRRRRHRKATMAVFTIIVILILLVIGDRVAVAVAEHEIASQIHSADTSINPSVSIKGFPFLTQVVSRDLQEIDISASNVAAGPVSISSVNAVAKGVHVNGSFNGGEVDTISANVFVSFASLSSALTSQSGGFADLKLSPAPNNEIKASFGIAGTNVLTETGKITLKGNQVTVAWQDSGSDSGDGGLGGIIGDITGSGGSGGTGLPNLNFTIPKLPAGIQITNFSVTSTGIQVTGGAHNTTLSQ